MNVMGWLLFAIYNYSNTPKIEENDLFWPFMTLVIWLCEYYLFCVMSICYSYYTMSYICEIARIWYFFLNLKKLITMFLVVMETRSDKGANVESESSDPSNLVEYALKNLYAKFGELFQCLQLFNINKPSNVKLHFKSTPHGQFRVILLYLSNV